jgi:S-methylmethionine-dependent homocysteine/selenocysteine methylase
VDGYSRCISVMYSVYMIFGCRISFVQAFLTVRKRTDCRGIKASAFSRNGATSDFSSRHCGKMYNNVLLLDGGTGEELFARGVEDDRVIWTAVAVKKAQYHNILRDVHRDFLRAGCDFVTCNNFGITPGVGFEEDEMKALTRKSGEIAREVVDQQSGRVLGSLPPLVESYRADKVMDHHEGVRIYKDCIIAVLNELVDGWLAETLSSAEEVIMALDALHEFYAHKDDQNSMIKPVYVSMTVKRGGMVRSGESASDSVMKILKHCDAIGESVSLQGIMFNCSMPEDISMALDDVDAIRDELALRGVLLGAYPNRLTEIADDWELKESSEPQAMRTDLSVETFVETCLNWVEGKNVSILGGCCGICPLYMAALRDRLRSG